MIGIDYLYYMLVVIVFVIVIYYYIQSHKIKNKLKKVNSPITACEVIREVLDDHNLKNVFVLECNGIRNNYYDISKNTVRLSKSMFNNKDYASFAEAVYIANYANINGFKKTLLKIYETIKPILMLLTYVAYIYLIVSIILMSQKDIMLSLGIFSIIFIINICFITIEKDVVNKALTDIEQFRYIPNSITEDIKNYIECMKYKNVTYIVEIIPKTYDWIIKKG